MRESARVACATVALALATGCTTTKPFTAPANGATAANTIEVGGYTRTYRLHTGAARPKALLVVLHGGGGDSSSMESKTGLSVVADREGFDVAYPDGLGILGWAQMWNAGHCCGRPQVLGVDDVAFVRALVLDLASRLGVPTDRVFLVGYSNGGLLAYRAGSELSGILGGIVVFAGTMRAHGTADAPIFELAPPVRPLSVLSVHGTRDNRIGYHGSWDDHALDVSFEQAGRFWAVANRCRAKPILESEWGGMVREAAYRGCPPGRSVVELTIVDGDHEWPSHERTGGFDLGDRIGTFVSSELRARSGEPAPPPAPVVHEEPFEHRGVRRAGITIFTIGVSALPSSLALYTTTHHELGLESAVMAIGGHAMMAVGIPMWVYGSSGRRTHPRNAAVMYTGMLVAGLGFAALPPTAATLVASREPGISDRAASDRRTAAFVTGAAANALVAIGIPLWAWGAASPDDWRAHLEPYPFGVRGAF